MTAITTSLPPISSLDSYIAAVQKLPMLGEQEERQLAIRVIEHNDRDAAQALALAHLRYVVKIARGYMGYGLSLADLVQEGNIGLLKAVRRFSPDGGARLASFAAYWIRAEIHEFVIRNWRMVKIATTKAQRKLFFRLRSLISPKAAGRALSNDEATQIADTLGVQASEVHEMRQRLNAHDVSIDAPVGEDGTSTYAELYLPADSKTEPEHIAEGADSSEYMNEALRQSIKTLPARSQEIIEARWGNDSKVTLRELADKYGVSVERVRQIEKQAFQKIKKQLTG